MYTRVAKRARIVAKARAAIVIEARVDLVPNIAKAGHQDVS